MGIYRLKTYARITLARVCHRPSTYYIHVSYRFHTVPRFQRMVASKPGSSAEQDTIHALTHLHESFCKRRTFLTYASHAAFNTRDDYEAESTTGPILCMNSDLVRSGARLEIYELRYIDGFQGWLQGMVPA